MSTERNSPKSEPGQEPGVSDILSELRLLRQTIEADMRLRTSWKLALRNGAIGAIGGLLASTILLAAVVHVFQPLNRIAQLKPVLERLANEEARHPNR